MTENNTDSTTPTPSGKVESDQVKELLEIARRNTAIAHMLGFKKYVPAQQVHQTYKIKYHSLPMEWFHIPGIGNYNSFELRFNQSWDWLVSALIEMKKFPFAFVEMSHDPDMRSLHAIWWQINQTRPIDFDMKQMWILVSDYALLLQTIKAKEKIQR